MASVGGESTGKKRGGRRSLDAPVNLIPYIDLMTTIITFLMMTAVWIQVSALDVQSDSLSNEVPVENTVQPKPIAIVMDENGFVVSEDGDNPQPFAKIDGNYDLKSLSMKLEQLKAQSETLAEVQIFSADAVKYDNIVKVIDVVAGLGFAPANLKALSAS